MSNSMDKRLSLDIIGSLGLQLIAFIDMEGIEQNALVHRQYVESLVDTCPPQPFRLEHVSLGEKRPRDDDDDSRLSQNATASLMSSINYGPYSKELGKRSYVELNDEMALYAQ